MAEIFVKAMQAPPTEQFEYDTVEARVDRVEKDLVRVNDNLNRAKEAREKLRASLKENRMQAVAFFRDLIICEQKIAKAMEQSKTLMCKIVDIKAKTDEKLVNMQTDPVLLQEKVQVQHTKITELERKLAEMEALMARMHAENAKPESTHRMLPWTARSRKERSSVKSTPSAKLASEETTDDEKSASNESKSKSPAPKNRTGKRMVFEIESSPETSYEKPTEGGKDDKPASDGYEKPTEGGEDDKPASDDDMPIKRSKGKKAVESVGNGESTKPRKPTGSTAARMEGSEANPKMSESTAGGKAKRSRTKMDVVLAEGGVEGGTLAHDLY